MCHRVTSSFARRNVQFSSTLNWADEDSHQLTLSTAAQILVIPPRSCPCRLIDDMNPQNEPMSKLVHIPVEILVSHSSQCRDLQRLWSLQH